MANLLVSGITKPDKVAKKPSHVWHGTTEAFIKRASISVRGHLQEGYEKELESLVLHAGTNDTFVKELIGLMNKGMRNTEKVSNLLRQAIELINRSFTDKNEMLLRYRIIVTEKLINDELEPLENSLNIDLGEFVEQFRHWWSEQDLPHNTLYEDEIEAFQFWKDDAWYKVINGILYGKIKVQARAIEMMNIMQKFMLSSKDYPRSMLDFTVLRAFWPRTDSDDKEQRGPDFHSLKAGDILKPKGFLATSYGEPPKNFVGPSCCIMIIEVPAGFPCVILQSKFAPAVFDAEDEDEVLFPFGIELEFVNIELRKLKNRKRVECARFRIVRDSADRAPREYP